MVNVAVEPSKKPRSAGGGPLLIQLLAHGGPLRRRGRTNRSCKGERIELAGNLQREGASIGPFESKFDAQRGLGDFIDFIQLAEPRVLSSFYSNLSPE